jgi:hypothetical protein
MAQRYSREDCLAFIEDLYPLFRDRRYVRVDGRPLLLVYKIADIPDVAGVVALWRDAPRASGIGELYLAGVQHRAQDDPTALGFDAAVEFPPIGHWAENITARMRDSRHLHSRPVCSITGASRRTFSRCHDPLFASSAASRRCGTTPRAVRTRDDRHRFLARALPGLAGGRIAADDASPAGRRAAVFVVAWNEWAEGNHLEPDVRFGGATLKRCLTRVPWSSRPLPRARICRRRARDRGARASGGIAIERIRLMATVAARPASACRS